MTNREPVNVATNGAVRYGIYDAAGNLLRYEYIKLEDGAVVAGTPLNKATFLQDDTAEGLGLNPVDDPTVNDALSRLTRQIIGDILQTVRDTPGSKYLLCDGAYYDIDDYPDLAAADPKETVWRHTPITGTTGVFAYNIIFAEGVYIFLTQYSSYYVAAVSSSIFGPWAEYQIISVTTADDLRRIKYVNGYFIAPYRSDSGDYPYIVYTDDLTGTWATKWISAFGGSDTIVDICSIGTDFLAAWNAGAQLHIGISPTIDGTYERYEIYSDSSNGEIKDISVDNDTVILPTESGSTSTRIFFSTIVGVTGTWHNLLISNRHLQSAKYHDGRWAIAGYTDSTNTAVVCWSDDLDPVAGTATWNIEELSVDAFSISMDYTMLYDDASGNWVMTCGKSNDTVSVFYSPDLTNWTRKDIYTGNLFVTRSIIANGFILTAGHDSSASTTFVLNSDKPSGGYKILPDLDQSEAFSYIRALL